jgi:hypothetical protein
MLFFLSSFMLNCSLLNRFDEYRNEPICQLARETCDQAKDLRKKVKDRNDAQLKQAECDCERYRQQCNDLLNKNEEIGEENQFWHHDHQ